MIEMKDHFMKVLEDDDFDIYLMVGGYGSGKSFTGFLKTGIKATMEKRKMLVVRKVFATIKDSCCDDLKEGIELINKMDRWKFKVSPLEANCTNGSKIIFRGMDDWRKIKSIKNIDYIIVEEADELTLDDLKELRKRLRVNNIKKHIIFMCNPISKRSSIYKMFFTEEGFNFSEQELYKERILEKVDKIILDDGTEEFIKIKVHHSVYKDNPFLPPSFIYELENEKDPILYRVGTKGRFGEDGVRVFHNVVKKPHSYVMECKEKIGLSNAYDGLDFGFEVSYNALVRMFVDVRENKLYIYNQMYNRKLITSELIRKLEYLKKGFHRIIADSARPEIIEEIKRDRFKIKGAKKGPGSVLEGLHKLRSFDEIIISDECSDVYKDFSDLCYGKDKNGDILEQKFNLDPHGVDAARYGLEDYRHTKLKYGFKKKPIGL